VPWKHHSIRTSLQSSVGNQSNSTKKMKEPIMNAEEDVLRAIETRQEASAAVTAHHEEEEEKEVVAVGSISHVLGTAFADFQIKPLSFHKNQDDVKIDERVTMTKPETDIDEASQGQNDGEDMSLDAGVVAVDSMVDRKSEESTGNNYNFLKHLNDV
jgi:hypothetical protein